MEIASLIIATISLIMGIASMSWLISKEISSHTIQYVPAPMPNFAKEAELMSEQFREFDSPLDEEEKEYFRKQKEAKKA